MAGQSAGPVTKWVFGLMGVGIIVGSFYWGRRQYTALETWPRVDAVVVSSQVAETMGEANDTGKYWARIKLKYSVGGKEYSKIAGTGSSTSSRSTAREEVAKMPPGTHLMLPYNPADPYEIKLGVGWNFSTFGLPLMGVLTGLALVLFSLWSVIRPARTGLAASSQGNP
jgi:Protein of unknown function (DUF3592)